MSFTISIEGLAQIEEIMRRTPSLGYIRPDISVGILKLHNDLADEVALQYFVPYNLDNVFLGASTLSRNNGEIIDAGLAYKEKKVPLELYPHKESNDLEVRNAIPFKRNKKDGTTSVGYIQVNRARSVKTTISRKGSKGNIFLKRTKYKKFLAAGKIFARLTDKTWDELPELSPSGEIEGGTRAPITALYGPTLADLASNVFNKSNTFNAKVDKFSESILNKFKDFYA